MKSSSWPVWRRWRWRRSARIWSSASPMSAASRTRTVIDPTDRGLERVEPSTCRLAVENGIRTRSSWSWPHADLALRLEHADHGEGHAS